MEVLIFSIGCFTVAHDDWSMPESSTTSMPESSTTSQFMLLE